MAIPDARIYSFGDGVVMPVTYDEFISVTLMKDFLQAPEGYLRMIWEGEA